MKNCATRRLNHSLRKLLPSFIATFVIFMIPAKSMAVETIKFNLEFYYFYQEKWGATCFAEIKPPKVTLVLEKDGDSIVAGRFLGFPNREFLPNELKDIELKGGNDQYHLKRFALSTRLLSWVLIEKGGCPYSWDPIRTTEPSLVFKFEIDAQERMQKAYSDRIHFRGVGVYRRPYIANMLIGQSPSD